MLIAHREDLNRIAAAQAGPKLFSFTGPVVANHIVGCFEDMLSAPIVLLQTDRPAAFELMLKGQNILDGGTAKTIDALVVIPDDAEIAVLGSQK